MNWKAIRLELARTTEFPEGSASRSYLLRLPLDDDGSIDAEALEASPDHATIRRFWPSEPDLLGHVVRSAAGWGFLYETDEGHEEPVGRLEADAIRLGGYVTVAEPDGRRLPFRVASLQQLTPRHQVRGMPFRLSA